MANLIQRITLKRQDLILSMKIQKMISPAEDADKYKRGGVEYIRPIGWMRFAIKLDKYGPDFALNIFKLAFKEMHTFYSTLLQCFTFFTEAPTKTTLRVQRKMMMMMRRRRRSHSLITKAFRRPTRRKLTSGVTRLWTMW